MRDFKSRNSFNKLGHDRNQFWDDSFFVICSLDQYFNCLVVLVSSPTAVDKKASLY